MWMVPLMWKSLLFVRKRFDDRGGGEPAVTRPTDSCHNVIAGLDPGDIGTDSFDAPKALMTDDQVVESRRGRAILRGSDFLVSTVDADTQNFHQHPAAVRNIIERRFRASCRWTLWTFPG